MGGIQMARDMIRRTSLESWINEQQRIINNMWEGLPQELPKAYIQSYTNGMITVINDIIDRFGLDVEKLQKL